MSGALVLGPDDDRFHPPSDDPFYTETAWFGFAAPERGLAGAVYPLFRPTLGVASLAVHVWDPTGAAAHEARYSRSLWHLPMPDTDLDHLVLGVDGIELRYEVLEALSSYRLEYRDGDRISLDLRFDGLIPPNVLRLVEGRGHLDQPGRVTGLLVLDGEPIDIDCFEMRDRSWGSRPDTRPTYSAYTYGTAADTGFQAVTLGGETGGPVIAGYLWQDDEVRPLTGGERTVERAAPGEPPTGVDLHVVDDAGRELRASGVLRSHFEMWSSPNLFAFMSLAGWHVDGDRWWGEDQEVWSPDQLPRGRQTS